MDGWLDAVERDQLESWVDTFEKYDQVGWLETEEERAERLAKEKAATDEDESDAVVKTEDAAVEEE